MAAGIQKWFAQQVKATIRTDAICAALLIPGGLLAMFLTYWIVFGLIWLGLGSLFDLATSTIHALAGFFLVASFAWQFTAGRSFQETYNVQRDDYAEEKIMAARATGNQMALLLDPGMASMFVRVITLAFLMGPRMLDGSWNLWRKVQRLKQMDVSGSGRVLALLMRAQGRVDVEDIAKKFPEGDVMKFVQPLADFDGVVFLHKGSLGLTLAPRLVTEFEQWCREN